MSNTAKVLYLKQRSRNVSAVIAYRTAIAYANALARRLARA